MNTTHTTLIKVIALIAIIALFAAIELIVPGFYSTIISLARAHNMHGIIAYISSFGYQAMAISILIIIVTNITGLPSIQILIASGIIFGLVPGIIICWIGEFLGNVTGFFVIRLLFRGKAHTLIAKNKTLEKIDSYSNFKEMLIARLIPFSPNVLITTLGALSHLSFRDHALATFIGKLPSVALEVWLGRDLLRLAAGGHWKMLATLAIVAAALAFYVYKRKSRSQEPGARSQRR